MLFMAMRAAAALASSITLGSVWPAASANTAAAISGLRVGKADATAVPQRCAGVSQGSWESIESTCS